ncbi:uncharacterized protein PITG_02160 [Phytophthora infestans T30-4]|uniref:Uncharacterized protein n=1 Tax=Phytophthora infestans (strain T30-4) TaxID=403677 RepID=D0MVM3_PHYIT|nr:uncharacterized protein PITG_02160 [Phytophthora infestans T30-4]EEY63686.1 hypothetical protein PITG_02160 [Phytophthora infestans T30-4]|eukprot:XP_002907122.1 hypothetical protein PITG_02160 [Phytophthora infestans T30-4]
MSDSSGGTLQSRVCSTCFSTLHGIVVTVYTILRIANVAAGRTMSRCFGNEELETPVGQHYKSFELQRNDWGPAAAQRSLRGLRYDA